MNNVFVELFGLFFKVLTDTFEVTSNALSDPSHDSRPGTEGHGKDGIKFKFQVLSRLLFFRDLFPMLDFPKKNRLFLYN